MAVTPTRPQWFVRRDVAGFWGLALDNLIQLLLIVGLCRGAGLYPRAAIWSRSTHCGREFDGRKWLL